jgi:hypothetical protein
MSDPTPPLVTLEEEQVLSQTGGVTTSPSSPADAAGTATVTSVPTPPQDQLEIQPRERHRVQVRARGCCGLRCRSCDTALAPIGQGGIELCYQL